MPFTFCLPGTTGHHAPLLHHPCGASPVPPPHLLSPSSRSLTQAEPLTEFQAVHGSCTAAELLPSGTHCAAGYQDGVLRLFNVARAALVWACPAHPSPCIKILAHPTQPMVLSASR